MKYLAALLLVGCNQIFGLAPTGNVDSSVPYFDAAPDASPVCEDPGVVPRFGPELHQVVYSTIDCKQYQTSSIGLAIARCAFDSSGKYVFREAHVDDVGEMAPVRGDLDDTGFIYAYALAPEGDQIFIARYDPLEMAGIWRYERDATGAWSRKEKTNIPLAAGQQMSTVSRAPSRRIFVIPSNQEIDEYKQDASGGWSLVSPYTPAEFGASYVYEVTLSADGLRLFLVVLPPMASSFSIRYAARASLDQPFTDRGVVPGVPSVGNEDLFLTGDCGRMYLTGLSTVFYVRRL